MERIHALKSDGSVIKDIKVFQEAYNLIDLGWIYAPTKIPIFDKFIEFIYRIWAKYRLKLTFRPSIEKLCSEKGCEPFQLFEQWVDLIKILSVSTKQDNKFTNQMLNH